MPPGDQARPGAAASGRLHPIVQCSSAQVLPIAARSLIDNSQEVMRLNQFLPRCHGLLSAEYADVPTRLPIFLRARAAAGNGRATGYRTRDPKPI